ncbi:ribonuclease H-like domain-containing protein [Ferruginibacter albus]|uniref:ribonuclease H-like domain-containing protein n=1 Tax=Ferruginibacter albus TaxID=2875540 RepID=UPI001CC4B098|nr:ribonuclease H-like domain-containing protein [Ferruginibacter albus]UAY52609.1 ribonuclease H-like domain-containing protein [Ferruginibacter albus]
MITSLPLEKFLFIDIETVSQSENFQLLTEEWKMLWQEKVFRTLPDGVSVYEYYPQRAGIMAEFAKVICISIGYFRKENNNYQLRIKSIYGDDEGQLLQSFIQTVNQLEAASNKWSFTGHNIKEFDIPFLCRRLLVNNLPIPAYLDFQNMKPWETNLIDTFQYWRFGDYKNFTSLKLLAAALGVPSPKDDIDGSMVGEVYWKEKDLQRIVIYCQKDVVTVANIVLRFKNQPVLKEEQIIFVK